MSGFSEKSSNSGLIMLVILVIGLFAIVLIKTPISILFGSIGVETDINTVEARIKKVGSINMGSEPLSVVVTNVEPVKIKPAKNAEVVEVTVPAVCNGCHSAGILGAPKVGNKDDWVERARQGIEALVMSVSKGKGNMPPQGVNFNNDQLKKAIEAMLIKSGLK